MAVSNTRSLSSSEKEKQLNKEEHWNKLDKTVKLQKLKKFVDQYSKDNNLNSKDTNKFIGGYGFILVGRGELKYQNSNQGPKAVLTNVKCVSRPGVRIYANAKQIPQVLGGLGLTILSTSKGILTDYEARNLRVGGEVLCILW